MSGRNLLPTAPTEWIQARHFDFFDAPRHFVFIAAGRAFWLGSPFEEEQDDYKSTYEVWELSETSAELLDALSWDELTQRRVKSWGEFPIKTFHFRSDRQHREGKFYDWMQYEQ